MTPEAKQLIQMVAWSLYAMAATVAPGIKDSHDASDWADHLLKSFNKKFFKEGKDDDRHED